QSLSPPPADAPPTRLPPTDAPLQTAQLLPTPALPQTVPPPQPTIAPRTTFRSVKIFPRAAGMGPSVESITTPAGEKVAIITGGVNVIVQGLSTDNLPQVLGPLGDVDIEADRVVIWGADLSGLNGAAQDNNAPLQIYMEGNIIFRQGDRTVYADQ